MISIKVNVLQWNQIDATSLFVQWKKWRKKINGKSLKEFRHIGKMISSKSKTVIGSVFVMFTIPFKRSKNIQNNEAGKVYIWSTIHLKS